MRTRYGPIVHDLWEVPKHGGGVRVMTTLSPDVALTYARAVASAVPGVSGHGVRTPPGGLMAARAAWRRSVDVLTAGSVVIRSDVRECYASIAPDAAGLGLAASGAGHDDVERIREILRAVQTAGAPGLPIGPAPSAVVADAVLAVGDRAVRRSGGRIVRWVDDVVIAAHDRQAALRAFDAWRRTLRELGLSPHEGKTVVGFRTDPLPLGTPSAWSRVPHGMMRAP